MGRGFLEEPSRATVLQGPDSASAYVGEAGALTFTGANAEGVGRSSHYAPGPEMMPPWPCFSPQHLPVSDILYVLLISLLSLSIRCFMKTRIFNWFRSLQIPSTRMVTGTEEMLLDDLSKE